MRPRRGVAAGALFAGRVDAPQDVEDEVDRFEAWRSNADGAPCSSPQLRRAANGGDAFACTRSTCRLFVPVGPRCASLVADDVGPLTLEEVAAAFGVTRQRVEQVEAAALERLQRRHERDGELRELARHEAEVAESIVERAERT